MNEQEIFLAAIEIEDSASREEFLDQVCGDEKHLRQRILRLIAQATRDDSFLEPGDVGNTSELKSTSLQMSVGDQIGRYKLREKIGEGGMGVVYVAEQKEPVRRRVALKVIKPGMDSRDVIARFEAERQALAMMDHPNIARVLDAGTTEQGLPYFVMELVNGLPINRYCDENKLSIRERLELFFTVCAGVQHAHQKGIIHRDLKPSNVLVAQFDGQPVPKVIDFGVAKATGQGVGEHSVYTQLGQIVGTLDYMSPEQAQRNQLDVDTRSDIYSLGVMLYELLTGDLPFDKERLRKAAIDELLRIIREEDPPRPSTRVSTSQSKAELAKNRKLDTARLGHLFKGELDWIVMKALDKDRGRRYETASGFADDIRRYLADESVLACPPSNVYRLQKFWRRNRVAVSFVGTILFLSTVGAAVSIWFGVSANTAKKHADDLNRQLETEKSEAQEQRNAAIEARELAETRLIQARDAVDSMYVDFAEEWLDRKRLRKEQIAFLEEARDFYTSLADAEGSADESSQLKQAIVYQRIGRLESSLGNLQDALKSLKSSEEILLKIVESSSLINGQIELARTREYLVEILSSVGMSDESYELAKKSLDDLKAWTEREPDNDELQFRLAIANRVRGESASEIDYELYFERCVVLLKSRQDNDSETKWNIAHAYRRWAQNIHSRTEPANAEKNLKTGARVIDIAGQGLEVSETYVGIDPSLKARLQRNSLLNLQVAGYFRRGELAQAKLIEQRLLRYWTELAETIPDDPAVLSQACVFNANYALTLGFRYRMSGGTSEDPIEQFELSRRLIDDYRQRFPEQPDGLEFTRLLIANYGAVMKGIGGAHAEKAIACLNEYLSALERGEIDFGTRQASVKSTILCYLIELHCSRGDRIGFEAIQRQALDHLSKPINGMTDYERLAKRCEVVTLLIPNNYFVEQQALSVCEAAYEECNEPEISFTLAMAYFMAGRADEAYPFFVEHAKTTDHIEWLPTERGVAFLCTLCRLREESFEIQTGMVSTEEGVKILVERWRPYYPFEEKLATPITSYQVERMVEMAEELEEKYPEIVGPLIQQGKLPTGDDD